MFLVKNRKLGNLYALKCLSKKSIKAEGMEDSVLSERNILSTVCYPLIVGYYKSFQDQQYIYLLLEYINGI